MFVITRTWHVAVFLSAFPHFHLRCFILIVLPALTPVLFPASLPFIFFLLPVLAPFSPTLFLPFAPSFTFTFFLVAFHVLAFLPQFPFHIPGTSHPFLDRCPNYVSNGRSSVTSSFLSDSPIIFPSFSLSPKLRRRCFLGAVGFGAVGFGVPALRVVGVGAVGFGSLIGAT